MIGNSALEGHRPEAATLPLAPDGSAFRGPRPLSLGVLALLALAGTILFGRLLALPENRLRGGYDETRYVLLAERIVDPRVAPPRIPQFPPGWPWVLSIAFRAGATLPEVHRLNLLLTALSVGIACWGMARSPHFGPLALFVIGLSLLSHRLTLGLSDSLLSEPLFLCVLASALLIARKSDWHRSGPLALGVLLVALRLVRTAGLGITLGVVSHALFLDRQPWRSRLRTAALLAGPSLLAELLLLWVSPRSSILSRDGYVGQARPDVLFSAEMLKQATEHFRDLVSACIPVVEPLWHPRALILAAGALVALLGLGVAIARCLVDRDREASAVCGYLALVGAWPHDAPRFFWPVLPWLFGYAWQGFALLLRRVVETLPLAMALPPAGRLAVLRAGAAGLVALVVGTWGAALADPPLQRASRRVREASFVDALEWIDRCGPSTPRVAAYDCYRLYWHRRDWTIVPLRTTNDVSGALVGAPDWVVGENEKLDARLWTSQGFRAAFDNGRVTVLERERSPEPSAGGR